MGKGREHLTRERALTGAWLDDGEDYVTRGGDEPDEGRHLLGARRDEEIRRIQEGL